MKTLFLALLLGVAAAAQAQVHQVLNGNTLVESDFLRAPFIGTEATGIHTIEGSNFSWNGLQATVSIEGHGTYHGLIVQTSGTEGIAIIGISESGAQALKGVQITLFDSSAATLWRQGTTLSSDAAEQSLFQDGSADFATYGRATGGAVLSKVDKNGARHPPHLADSDAQNDSEYFSTVYGKMVYKDTGGAVHPLY